MDAASLKALFAPFGPVAVKRMFGGFGVYADGLCFAIGAEGDVFLKTLGTTRAAFAEAGSRPFVYDAKGKSMETSYWRMPESAFDDEDELRRWARVGLDAARTAKSAKKPPRRR